MLDMAERLQLRGIVFSSYSALQCRHANTGHPNILSIWIGGPSSPRKSALMNARSFVTVSTDLALIEKIEIRLSLGSTVK
jgi:hypothetical protein